MSIYQLAMDKASALSEAALIAALIMGFGLGALLSFSPESLGEYDEGLIGWFIRLLVISICFSLAAVLINFAYGYALRQLAAHNDNDGILKLERNWKVYYSHIAANIMTAQSGVTFIIAAGLYVFEILEQSVATKMVVLAGFIIVSGIIAASYVLIAYASTGDWTIEDPMRLFENIDGDANTRNERTNDGVELAEQ